MSDEERMVNEIELHADEEQDSDVQQKDVLTSVQQEARKLNHSSEVTHEQNTVQSHNSAGVLVLQWLSYAFWGWMIASLWWLSSVAIGHFIDGGDDILGDFGSFSAYLLAATLVLFIIALVTDIVYSRREPMPKTGAAMVIMIIHTVVYALFGIGAVIAAVFASVQLMIGDSDGYGVTATTVLLSALLAASVYGALLLRIVRPKASRLIAKVYWVYVCIVAIAVMVFAVIGPIAEVRLSKSDSQIESGLPQVSTQINRYTTNNLKLPASLDDIKSQLTGNAKVIIDQKLVSYQPGAVISPASASTTATSGTSLQESVDQAKVADRPAYNYTLCVEYKYDKNGDYASDYTDPTYRTTTPSTYYHAKGKVCYDLVTSDTYAY